MLARQLIEFINASPSPYHAVDTCKRVLSQKGFVELDEKRPWDALQPVGKYYMSRNQSSLVAFQLGGRWMPGNGFSIVGAHTDSPCLKVKPISKQSSHGYRQLGVAPYGGGIWYTWFDRELKLAGRALIKSGALGGLSHRLVHIDRPLVHVPTLCIHLNREYNEQFVINKQNHLVPILATETKAQLMKGVPATDPKEKKAEGGRAPQKQSEKHDPLFLTCLQEALECQPDELIDFELFLSDFSPARIGGVLEEFVFAPRLDNQFNCFTGLHALISAENIQEEENVRMLCLFDNEEVGSETAQGACSALLQMALRRISASTAASAHLSSTAYEEAVAKSFFLSTDQAHAVHPNYSAKHDSAHQPSLQGGVVMKVNANQRYATTSVTSAILREIAADAGVPLQDFAVRNDSACGSTIGPIVAARLGMQTADVGGAQLSMHSAREMCGVDSVEQAAKFYQAFYEQYPSVFRSLQM